MASRRTSNARLPRSELERSLRRRTPRTESLKPIRGIPRYTLLSSLAPAGERDLYLAQHLTPLGPRRAVLVHLPRSRRGYLALRERMIEEGRLSEKLSHPSFLPFLEAHEDGAGFTLAYEHSGGTDLSRVVRDLAAREEALPFELIVHVVRELARAAAYVHREHSLVLRELRPENILITKDGRILIATHRLGLGNAEHHAVAGASAHLAPESISHAEYGVASDVYALGVLLFTLFTGQAPPEGGMVPLDRLEEEDVPERLIGIVARATHPAKLERHRDALRLAGELDAWLASREADMNPELVAAFFRRHRLVTGLMPRHPSVVDVESNVFEDGNEETTEAFPAPEVRHIAEPMTPVPEIVPVAEPPTPAPSDTRSVTLRRPRGRWLWVLVLLALATGIGVVAFSGAEKTASLSGARVSGEG